MVRIEKNKLIIEFDTPDPEQFYKYLLRDIPTCVQAITERGLEERDMELPNILMNLLELYKAILPTGKQVDKILKKEK